MKKSFKQFIFCMVFLVFTSFAIVNAGANDLKSKSIGINKIPIAMATDNNYVYPTIIAMTSMLENKKSNTALEFYVMISGEVSNYNREKIKSLESLYENCSVNLFDMKDKFKTSYINPSHITTPTYYRLSLPSILSDYDKILYLDGDIIVTKDLWEMFNTDVSNCYIGAVKGFGQICFQLNPSLNYAKRLGVKDMNQCINAGILIMNLKQMREDKLEDKFNEFIPQLKSRRLILNDQDVLNAVCYDRIKFLSPKFNAFQHVTFNYDNLPILMDCYDMKEFKEACLNPTIIHYTSSDKPWKSNKCRFYSEWDKYRKIAEKKIYRSPIIKNDVYTISSALDSKKVLDISAGSKKDGANLQLWDFNKSPAQKFQINYVGEGYYKIKAMCSGKYLDVEGGKKEFGTNVQQYEHNDTDAQKWLIKDAGNGYFYIVSKCNDLYLDVSGARVKNGTNINVWGFNGSKAQKFKICK